MNPLIQFERISLPLLVVTVLVCLALSIKVEAGLHGPPPNCNTSDGFQALFSITTGVSDTAFGGEALFSDTTGSNNTAVGCDALEFNVGGDRNTATGNAALQSNTEGLGNTAVGWHALFLERTGSFSTAVGTSALESDTGAGDNSALGAAALRSNTTGLNNTAVGESALTSNTTGFDNIAIGEESGSLLTTGDWNIDIGNQGVAGEANTIRVGFAFDPDFDTGQNKTFIAGIRGITTGNADAVTVVIDSAGQLGTVSSSERFKKDIGPMDKASEAILALKPVTFHYKQDTKGIAQFGLIAEDVAKVSPDLVVRDKNGEIYSVRYDAVNAMLLNEFIKQHRKNEQQEATIAQLKSGMEALTATVKEQAAQIQRVSAQLEASRSAPQVADSNY
jgi:hypothetical protein